MLPLAYSDFQVLVKFDAFLVVQCCVTLHPKMPRLDPATVNIHSICFDLYLCALKSLTGERFMIGQELDGLGIGLLSSDATALN